jgi:nicotinamidase-related amidase
MNDAPLNLDPARTALLVMDFQPGIIGMLSEPDALVARVAETIALARRHGVHVGYVRVAFTDADYDDAPAKSRMAAQVRAAGGAFDADAPGTAIDERVAPEPGEIVVRKIRVGAFSTTDLDAQLRERGVDTLILAGISTSGVVLSTVRDAYDRDYELLVLADACADREPGVHEFLTEKIFPRQASVITTAELRATLERG